MGPPFRRDLVFFLHLGSTQGGEKLESLITDSSSNGRPEPLGHSADV